MRIEEIVAGKHIKDIYIVKKHSFKQSKSGSTYLDATLMDKTGSIPVKMWDVADNPPEISDGGFVEATFSTEEYNGTLQGKLSSIKKVSKAEMPDGKLKELVPCVEGNIEEMFEELISKLRNLDAPNYKDFAISMLEKCKADFVCYPAAKSVHHSEIGGLLLHTLEVVRIIESLYDAMPCFDKELCMVAGALHDIGKIREYTLGETGLVSEYSVKGQMLGHIYMGATQIGVAAKQYGVEDEYVMLLQHLILSHHGQLEFGSPVKPETIEAYVLHEADMISSHMQIYNDAIKDVEPGKFSQPIPSLDRVNVYNPIYKSKEKD